MSKYPRVLKPKWRKMPGFAVGDGANARPKMQKLFGESGYAPSAEMAGHANRSDCRRDTHDAKGWLFGKSYSKGVPPLQGAPYHPVGVADRQRRSEHWRSAALQIASRGSRDPGTKGLLPGLMRLDCAIRYCIIRQCAAAAAQRRRVVRLFALALLRLRHRVGKRFRQSPPPKSIAANLHSSVVFGFIDTAVKPTSRLTPFDRDAATIAAPGWRAALRAKAAVWIVRTDLDLFSLVPRAQADLRLDHGRLVGTESRAEGTSRSRH
jgi:hypothetical protein